MWVSGLNFSIFSYSIGPSSVLLGPHRACPRHCSFRKQTKTRFSRASSTTLPKINTILVECQACWAEREL